MGNSNKRPRGTPKHKKGMTYDIDKILRESNGSLNINNVIEQSKSNDVYIDLTRSYH